MGTQYLKGTRVSLYRFSDKYITPQYVSWINDQINNRYVQHGRIPIVNEEVYIPNPEETLLFAITTDDSDTFKYIGTATLHNIDWISRKAEIGYMIGDKEYWGKGYATETVGLLCDYAFDRLGLNKLNADVVSENIASQRVLEKNGFVDFAVNPKDFYLEGRYLDNILYYRFKNG